MTRQLVAIGCLLASLHISAANTAWLKDAALVSVGRTDYTSTDRLIVRLKSDPAQGVSTGSTSSPSLQSARAGNSAAEVSLPNSVSRDPLTEYRLKTTARLQTLTAEKLTSLRTMTDGAHIIRLNRRLPMAEVKLIAATIAQDPDVLEVLPDRLFFPQLTPADPQYTNQWNLTQANGINMPGAWDITTGSSSLIIAILDTGMLPHNDLAGRWIGGYDFVSLAERSNDSDLRDGDATDPGDWVTSTEAASGTLVGCPVTDSRWHGTAMAGIIAANANNATGIAGINWNAKILPVRVVGKCGGYESDIIDGMRWAVGIPVAGVPNNHATSALSTALPLTI